jgi:hypothetical protein
MVSSFPLKPSHKGTKMKICTKCNKPQEIENFAFKNKAKQTRSSWCKICQRAYAKKDYTDKVGYYKTKSVESKVNVVARNKKFIKDFLEANPCVDCGEADIQVLEFDHIDMVLGRGGRVSNLLQCSLELIKREISKCQVRCANCHVRRTRQQMNWLR